MPHLLPPAVAILGVVATVLVIRVRWRVKHSLYTSVREEQTRSIERRRRHVLAARPAPRSPVTAGETALELAFGLVSLAAALGLVLIGVIMAIGGSR